MTDTAVGGGGGPRTTEGKQIARWNAARHGIRSPAPVVPGLESTEDWERHLAGVLASLSPVGHLEIVLVERVALFSWRLHRVTRYETESIALYQEKAEDDLARERHLGSRVLGPDHPEDVRNNLKTAQAQHRFLKRLPKLDADKHVSAFDADSALWTVVECTRCAAEEEVAPEDLLEGISIPAIPDGVEWEEYEGWTAGMLRAGIEAIAEATEEDPKELLGYATAEASRKIIGAKQAVERVEKDLETMSRERLLPNEKTLEKVARYEAHLSRQLFKAMHELEALQARRSGGSAPLARLDVDGLADN